MTINRSAFSWAHHLLCLRIDYIYKLIIFQCHCHSAAHFIQKSATLWDNQREKDINAWICSHLNANHVSLSRLTRWCWYLLPKKPKSISDYVVLCELKVWEMVVGREKMVKCKLQFCIRNHQHKSHIDGLIKTVDKAILMILTI